LVCILCAISTCYLNLFFYNRFCISADNHRIIKLFGPVIMNKMQPMAEPKATEFVSIENLRFDPENPRLPSSVDGHKEPEVLKWMLEDATIPELMAAIGEQGYFGGEPLLVVQANKKKAGVFRVIEGNRRLAAVKLLKDPKLASTRQKTVQQISDNAKRKPDKLPVLVFGERDDILFYLGYRHVTGIKEWGPLAKARYLEQIAQKTKGSHSKKKFQEMARTIGSKWDHVAKLLTGFAIYKQMEESNFFEIENLDEETIDFSILTTALGYDNIVAHLGLKNATDPSIEDISSTRLKELTSWLFEKDENGQTKLGESRNLKNLNRIVANEAALKAFKTGYSIHQADLLAGAPKEIFQTAIRESKKSLETARDHMHLVEAPDQSDADVLEDIDKLARLLREWIHNKIV